MTISVVDGRTSYVKRYLQTGVKPIPQRVKTPLERVFANGIKKIPRNELRVIMRGAGVDTGKVINTGFVGKDLSFLIPAAYKQ